MEIVNIGCNYTHDVGFSINRPNGSGDYLLIVLKSDGKFLLNSEEVVAKKNSVIVFEKGTPQIYGAVDCEYINDWIHFVPTGEELMMLRKLSVPLNTIISMNDITAVSGMVKTMFAECYSNNVCKKESLELLMKLIFLKISENIRNPETQKENPYYRKMLEIRNEIYLKPAGDYNVDSICRRLNLSRSYVQHLYKDFFGESILSDVTNSRIEYAKYLLSGTDMTVTCISSMCGYSGEIHFMRMFKKVTSVTPTQFRENIHISGDEMDSLNDQHLRLSF